MNFSEIYEHWDDVSGFFGDGEGVPLPPDGWADAHQPDTWPAQGPKDSVTPPQLAATALDDARMIARLYYPIHGVTVDGSNSRNAALHHVAWRLKSSCLDFPGDNNLSVWEVQRRAGIDQATVSRYNKRYDAWQHLCNSATLMESTIWALISDLRARNGMVSDPYACEDELDDIYRTLVSLDHYLIDRCAAVQRMDDPLRAMAFHILTSYPVPGFLLQRFRIPPKNSEANLHASYERICEHVSGVERVSKILGCILNMEVSNGSAG